MKRKPLPRVKQCAKCPWKKTTNPNDIEGYCKTQHENLKGTIAKPGALDKKLTSMACHHSNGDDGMYCIGWLAHQLGPGNNLPLRIKMLDYDLSKVKTFGLQHDNFEDTLKNE